MISRNALNPADIVQLYKFFNQPDPPPVELIRIPQFLELMIDALFKPHSKINQVWCFFAWSKKLCSLSKVIGANVSALLICRNTKANTFTYWLTLRAFVTHGITAEEPERVWTRTNWKERPKLPRKFTASCAQVKDLQNSSRKSALCISASGTVQPSKQLLHSSSS